MVFHGVSYEAAVRIDGDLVLTHQGIWDAFSVPLGEPGRVADIRVDVTKNGGPKFPVQSVLSGFLPYVYGTFGGLFREVEVSHSPIDTSQSTQRAPKEFLRGILNWGWYADTGSPNPTRDMVQREVEHIADLGFNLVKFCLWLPPHHYLDELERVGLHAWIELPLWMPGQELDESSALEEVERIVLQYRRHPSIVAWTCGCELSAGTSLEFRRRLFELVSDLTGCRLVKDNSGGSEMYGGDLREFGTFYDYHPYCDLMYYPCVLESLRNGPRPDLPILLGEFCDFDTYRSLGQFVGEESLTLDPMNPSIVRSYAAPRPYWASAHAELNDRGVRWQYDLPRVLSSPLPEGTDEPRLYEASVKRAAYVRQRVAETVHCNGEINGYVITGLCDTPISTSGVKTPIEPNGAFFLLPHRRPPWVRGGNRTGWLDTRTHFRGEGVVQIGLRPEATGLFQVTVCGEPYGSVETTAGLPMLVATVPVPESGEVCVEVGDWRASWRLTIVDRLPFDSCPDFCDGIAFTCEEPNWRTGVLFLEGKGTVPNPFWRECVLLGDPRLCHWVENCDIQWPVAPDCTIDPKWLEDQLPDAEWLLTRIDTRTYGRLPYVARSGDRIVTTLRPNGGLGAQPPSFDCNPGGHELVRFLTKLLHTD
ncbi:MAG: hypothetical protein JNM34_06040 [Chthonomonadaceae bacterium]|nr:hypothetical protein [Chthonomonadaceae bacterium]